MKDPSFKLSISAPAKYLESLKTHRSYKKFEERYLHSSFELEGSEYSDFQKNFSKEFFSNHLTKQDLWEALNSNPNTDLESLESGLENYIQFWNKDKIRKMEKKFLWSAPRKKLKRWKKIMPS